MPTILYELTHESVIENIRDKIKRIELKYRVKIKMITRMILLGVLRTVEFENRTTVV
jgi:hypothetical protein